MLKIEDFLNKMENENLKFNDKDVLQLSGETDWD